MRVFLFDIDGTLVNTAGAGKAALNEAFATEFNIPAPSDVPLSGRTDRGIASNLFELHGIEDSESNWQRIHRAYVARLPVQLPLRKGVVLPGVTALLELLRGGEDAAIGLLTGNVPDGARIKLAHYGLYQHFAFGGYGDQHGHRDEVARAALAAARAHVPRDFAAERVWVIGDTPLDIRCARAIGARVLAVATGVFTAAELAADQPDLLCEDLSDTERVLESLLAD